MCVHRFILISDLARPRRASTRHHFVFDFFVSGRTGTTFIGFPPMSVISGMGHTLNSFPLPAVAGPGSSVAIATD
jgi:hypothetical protein